MPDSDIRDRISQLRISVFGVEGVGGLVREVRELDSRVSTCEQKIATASGKWLILMILLASVGQLGADFLIRMLLR